MSDGVVQVRVGSVAWFATAVVLGMVCTLLVTQAWSVGAAPGDDDSTFVPTAGCRLADTRPAPRTVGPRSTPLGAGDIYEVTVRGSNGECTGGLAIPSDAVAVALNVTATNATAASNIRLYPADLVEVPLLSNLNVFAGAPPTPNKVDVQLSPDGKIKVFNFNGSVNVILDVVGYYTDSSLQELAERVAALETAQPFAVSSRAGLSQATPTDAVVVSLTVTAPVPGQVTVTSTTTAGPPTAGGAVRCSITTGSQLDVSYLQSSEASGVSTMAGTRLFGATAGTTTYNLVCDLSGSSGSAILLDSVLTAIFTPTA